MGLAVNRKMVKTSIDIFSQLLAKKLTLNFFSFNSDGKNQPSALKMTKLENKSHLPIETLLIIWRSIKIYVGLRLFISQQS